MNASAATRTIIHSIRAIKAVVEKPSQLPSQATRVFVVAIVVVVVSRSFAFVRNKVLLLHPEVIPWLSIIIFSSPMLGPKVR